LPIGLQIVGAHLEDRTTLAFASAFSAEFGGFEAPPGLIAPRGATSAKLR
jgi:amidase